MSIKKFSMMLLSGMALAALLNGCGSSNKEGTGAVGNANVAKVPEAACKVCHAVSVDPLSGRNILTDYLASPHNRADAGCQGCHGGGAEHNGIGPIPFAQPIDRCKECHNGTSIFGVDIGTLGNETTTAHHTGTFFPSAGVDKCGTCHNPHNPLGHFVGGSCVACHAFPQDRTEKGNYVNDNNGVRAITGEFAKWSHHVTGVTLNDAHCAACHMEGKVVNGKVVVDTAKHMADAKTHLRNADSDFDMPWDPTAPNHSRMDDYCMSCHDADGATSPMSIQIQAFINSNGLAAAGKTASPSNPFGDTISNRYDKMQRPAVVDASSQFNTTNNSHHAVKGKRYTGRTREAGVGLRTIASPATFANNSSALLQGVRRTMYETGITVIKDVNGVPTPTFVSNLNQLYTPLENAGGESNVEGSLSGRTGAQTLGDDSTLHCGDCHTVGQWKPGSSDTANGNPTPVAIGAHGSNNEYLLRNTLGTDERHTQNAYLQGNDGIAPNVPVINPFTGAVIPNGQVVYTNPNGAFLICYNCHTYTQYGSIYLGTGLGTPLPSGSQPHAGEYDSAGRCNGIGNTLPFNGYTTGSATDGTQFVSRFEGPRATFGSTPAFAPGFPLKGTAPVGEQNPDFGNIFGIQCLNCHNSGAGNAYGGIHGSAKNTNTTTATTDPSVTGGAYIDGMGNTTKVQRFLPGLGNAAHVPGTLGGFTGGTVVPVNTAAGTPAYTYITGGISNDTNWEQKHWQQTATTVINDAANTVTGTLASAGAGCYTLGGGTPASATAANQRDNAAANRAIAPSVTGAGGPSTTLFDTWGGCDDHDAGQGRADHGFVKRIVRPITY